MHPINDPRFMIWITVQYLLYNKKIPIESPVMSMAMPVLN